MGRAVAKPRSDGRKLRTKARYDFVAFVQPDGYWPYPYTIEQAFGVLRWMIRTGRGYEDRSRWGTQNVLSLLSCRPSCTNFSEVRPITSLIDLERRFHYAILSRHCGPALRRWRKRYRVSADGSRNISFLHHQPYAHADGMSEAAIKASIDALLSVRGRLGVQLNKYHSRAREIYGVKLHCRNTFEFELQYGYQGSVWQHTLARQLPSETFIAAFRRAERKLAQLVADDRAACRA